MSDDDTRRVRIADDLWDDMGVLAKETGLVTRSELIRSLCQRAVFAHARGESLEARGVQGWVHEPPEIP